MTGVQTCALRSLGEEFPLEKLQEVRQELIADAQSEGALNLVRAQVTKELMDMTGMMVGPDGTATPVDPMMMGDGDVLGDGQVGPANPKDPNAQESQAQNLDAEAQIRQNLVQEAYNTVAPTRSGVDKD